MIYTSICRDIFKDCLESDVHHMTSQILSILIDFIPDRAFFVPFFRPLCKSLNINNSGTRNDIKKQVNGNLSDF